MDTAFQARVTVRISAFIAIALCPYVVYHLVQHNWAYAGLLGSVVAGEVLLIAFVRKGGSPVTTARMVASIYSFGSLYVVARMGLPATYWLFPATLSNFYILPMRSALLLNAIMLAGGTFLTQEQPEVAIRLASSLVGLNVFGFVFSHQVLAQRDRLNKLSLIDPLTLAQNRRAMDEQLGRTAKAKARYGGQVSAIMLDIDHFKTINDRFDHHTGDEVLKAIVALIKTRMRETDSLYRYGGEEFVVIAEQTGLEEARRLAEDLRLKVIAQAIGEVGPITISGGVAELGSQEAPMAWISRADDALYQAKRSGRNRVCIDASAREAADS